MKPLRFALLVVALTSPALSAQTVVPPECKQLSHPDYDNCVTAARDADHDAAEKEFRTLPPETRKRLMERSMYRIYQDGRLTTEGLHNALAELKGEADAKAAKERAVQARKKADQEAIRQYPDKDPKWLLSKAGRVWRKHPSWSIADCDRIGDGRVWIGMTAEQALASWGRPKHVNADISAAGKSEQWVYGDDYLYVAGGKVTHLQTSR
jgi:hypothetical protein